MIDNLNVECYLNGDSVPEVKDKYEWENLNTGAWCYYDNDKGNGDKTGKLYNWYALNDSRGLAPLGWHIPNGGEFQTLLKIINGNEKALKIFLQRTEFGSGSNDIGHTNLFSGTRNYDGKFANPRFFIQYWTTSEISQSVAYSLLMSLNDYFFCGLVTNKKTFGFSVRCIKNKQ